MGAIHLHFVGRHTKRFNDSDMSLLIMLSEEWSICMILAELITYEHTLMGIWKCGRKV